MADETVTEPVNTAAPEEQATTRALPRRLRQEDSGGQAARCRPGRRHRRLFRG